MTPLPRNNCIRNLLRIQLVLCALLLHGLPDRPDALAGDELLDRVIGSLQQRYETIQDLESDFTQLTRFKGFSTTIRSKGRMYLKKGRFRWDYLEPEGEQIFMRGDQVLLYVPEHQQVIKSRMDTQTYSQVPVRLLAGSAHISQDFVIQWKDEQNHKTPDGDYSLMLRPKSPASGFTQIEMEVDSNENVIRRIRLAEPGGNSSDIRFQNTRINRGLKDRIFEFKIPEGVVVVEQP